MIQNSSKKQKRREAEARSAEAQALPNNLNLEMDGLILVQDVEYRPLKRQRIQTEDVDIRYPPSQINITLSSRNHRSRSANTPAPPPPPHAEIHTVSDSDDEDIEIVEKPPTLGYKRGHSHYRQNHSDPSLPAKKKPKLSNPIDISSDEDEGTPTRIIVARDSNSVVPRDREDDTWHDRISEENLENEAEEIYRKILPIDDENLWSNGVTHKRVEEVDEVAAALSNTHLFDEAPQFESNDNNFTTGRLMERKIGYGRPNLHLLQISKGILRTKYPPTKRNSSRRIPDMRLGKQLDFTRPVTSTKFRESAGAINRIVQHNGFTYVASTTVSGGRDEVADVDMNPDPYNKSGCLVALNGLEAQVVVAPDNSAQHPGNSSRSSSSPPPPLPAHSRKIASRTRRSEIIRPSFIKHYTVNDVAFCDRSNLVISTGSDCKLGLWRRTLIDGKEVLQNSKYITLPKDCEPLEIVVKADDSIFAVASRQPLVHSQHLGFTPQPLPLVQAGDGCRAASMRWGANSILYVSSESPRGVQGRWCHKAFDVHNMAEVFDFNLDEDGDTLGIDPFGNYLAMCTVNRDEPHQNRHILRLFDVRNNGRNLMHQINMEPADVNCVTFSPDSLNIAVARTDGQISVYDARFLDRQQDFRHNGPSRVSPGNDNFGIVHAEWRSRNNHFSLLTGGPDGFIRRWHPLFCPPQHEQGEVIAETDADVSYFSLGDRSQNENELVVGDGDGCVYVFNGIGNI